MQAKEQRWAGFEGFWPSNLKIGKDLLVYAHQRGQVYVTSTCGRHIPAEYAAEDLAALGPGHEPRK
jgi:hypothetical protein